MSFWRKQVIEPALNSGINEEIWAQRKLVEEDPSSAKAWFGLGGLYHVAGNQREALRCYLKAIECDGGFAAAHVAAGRIFAVEGAVELAWLHAREAERLGDSSLVEQLSRYLKPPEASGA
jgi:tetratricopeptide (TPR) repeat protein